MEDSDAVDPTVERGRSDSRPDDKASHAQALGVRYRATVDTFVGMKRLVLVVASLGLVVAACGSSSDATEQSEFDSVASRALPTAGVGQSVGSRSLPDVANGGEPFEFRATVDGLLIVYFGFTACPDICPTTLADLKTALADLGDASAAIDVAMVTVDPGRDSARTLIDYVQWFIPDAHALRTEDQVELDAVGDAFGAEFSVTKAADGRVEVLHTAYLYAVDDAGNVVAAWSFGVEPTEIASGLAALLTG